METRSRPVGQTSVNHRRALVDAPADRAHDLVDGAPQVPFVDELDVGVFDLAAPLDIYRLRTVHHDFGDARVVQEAVDRPVANGVVGDVLDELRALGPGSLTVPDIESENFKAIHARMICDHHPNV